MYLLGYDVGTSSVKACILEAESGKVVASDFFPKQEAPIKSLRHGWAEQDPHSWWNSVVEVTRSVLSASNVDKYDIKAIGISYQMHGVVLIDSHDKVIRDSVIWCDSRGVPYGEKAVNDLGADTIMEEILNRPGNFTATKLAWIKENEPDSFNRIKKVMLPGDYIAFRMTGRCVTNPEGLSEYMLWDFKSETPSHRMLDYFGFSEDILPEVEATFGNQGELTEAAANELGLWKGLPVTYRAGDQPNNALSLNVFEPGEIASTAGTSGVVYGINGTLEYDSLSRVNNFAHVNHTKDNPRIGVMTCINGTGILNSWIKKNIAPEGISYNEMNRLAAEVPVGSEGISILPFGNGAERVLENHDIGCSIHGINFNIHDKRHIYRAAQEGIVFAFMYGMEIMRDMGMEIKKIHAGHANMFLSSVFRGTLASVSNAVICLYDTDGAAGAARGAGLGAGIYKSREEAFDALKCIEIIYPSEDRAPYLDAYSRWKEFLRKEMSHNQ